MKCSLSRKLAEYQVGALDERARDEVARHLQGCAVCQAELAALNRTAALLQPMPQADAPPEVWAKVAHQLTPRGGVRAPAPQRRFWVPAMAAAILILIIGLAVILPMLHGHMAGVPQDSFGEIQVAAAWDSPLADKEALGLAMRAADETDPWQDLQEAPD